MKQLWIGGLAALLVAAGILVRKRSQSSDSPFPVEIRCGQTVTRPQVVYGSAVLILAPDGIVWAWGENRVGAAKDQGGLLAPIGVRGEWAVPRRLEVGSNWIALAAGYTDAIGIKRDGSLWGWTFAPTQSHYGFGPCTNPPTAVATGTKWVAVAAAGGHALALQADGSLWAIGSNERGELGIGTITPFHPGRGARGAASWIRVGTNQNWIAIAADVSSSLGLQADGTLWRWGLSRVAMAGTTETNLSVPTLIGAETNWVAIAANSFSCVGLKRDHSLWGWGANAAPFGCPSWTIPRFVSSTVDWSRAAVGRGMLVALDTQGRLWQAGTVYDKNGGDNRITTRSTPTLLGSERRWRDVWAGAWTGFGLTEDGILWTWGHRPDIAREGSAALGSISHWLWEQRVASPIYERRPIGSESPWPLVRFVTNAPSSSC